MVCFSFFPEGTDFGSLDDDSLGVAENVFETACEQYEKAENRLDILRNLTQRNPPEVK